jgi:hypothetical protein
VIPASIGIKTDDDTKDVALGSNLSGANDHERALGAFRAALRIKPIGAYAPEWLVVVLNAQEHPDHLCKIDNYLNWAGDECRAGRRFRVARGRKGSIGAR